MCEVICRELNHELKVISVPDSFGTAARALSLNGSVHHNVINLFKIKTQLGYRDLIPDQLVLRRIVEWILATSANANLKP